MKNRIFVPITPGGTICIWLEAKTKKQAWKNLIKDAEHMPYGNKKGFISRGYTVEAFIEG